MPYNIDKEQDDEQQVQDTGSTGSEQSKKTTQSNQEAGGQLEANPTLSGESGASFGSSDAGSNGASTTPAKSASSGSFTNLQSYLSANEGNNPASSITSKVEPEAQQAQQGLEQSQKAFQKGIEGQTQYNPDLIANAAANPTAVDPNAVIAQRHASYSGTQGLDESQGYNPGQAARVQSEVEGTKTEPGQFALLQQLVSNPNRPTYSQGEQKLDQLLLQSNPAQQSFKDLQSKYGSIGSDYKTAQTKAIQDAQAASKNAEQAALQSNQQINSGYQNLANMLQQQYGTAQSQAETLANSARNAAANKNLGGLTDEQLNQLGLGGIAGRTYGIDPNDSKYWSGYKSPTLSSVASPDQLAKAAAYSKLLERPDIGNQYNQAEAGTYKSPISFNNDQYQKDLAASKASSGNQAMYWGDIPEVNHYTQVPYADQTGWLTYQDLMGQLAKGKNEVSDLQASNLAARFGTTPEAMKAQLLSPITGIETAATERYNKLLDSLGIVNRR